MTPNHAPATPTPASTAAAPGADTLDEAVLRQVFAAAPASLDVPRDVGSIFGARMRGLGGDNAMALRIGWLLVLLLGGVLALVASPALGAGIAGLALVVVIGVALWQYSQASDDFFDLYATARGLQHVEGSRISANVPLFGKGDKREWPRVLTGTIGGQRGKLGLYTYTEVTTDSEGNRDETDHDFTVLHFELPTAVADRFAGVYCSPRTISFGALQDKLAHDRKVELESVEFHSRYSLRVVDEQDDIALYELFSTTFVHHLATQLEVYWEQRGEDLVVWKKGHETEAADLDRLCAAGCQVLQRYLEEHR